MIKYRSEPLSVNEIIPGLWLGNETASQNKDFLQKADIQCIINATKHIPCTYQSGRDLIIDYYRVPVNDPGPTDSLDQVDNTVMLEHLPKVIKYIHQQLNSGKNILVHCHQGVMRSATITLCYLFTYTYTTGTKKERLYRSLITILKNRPCAFHYGQYSSFRPATSKYIDDT